MSAARATTMDTMSHQREAELGRQYAAGRLTLDEVLVELAAIWDMRRHVAAELAHARMHLLGLVAEAYEGLGLEFPGLAMFDHEAGAQP